MNAGNTVLNFETFDPVVDVGRVGSRGCNPEPAKFCVGGYILGNKGKVCKSLPGLMCTNGVMDSAQGLYAKLVLKLRSSCSLLLGISGGRVVYLVTASASSAVCRGYGIFKSKGEFTVT